MCVVDPCFGRTRASTRQVEGSLLGLRSHGVGARAYDVVCVDTDRQVVGNLARTLGVRLPGFSNAGFWCCSGAPALDREQVLELLEHHVRRCESCVGATTAGVNASVCGPSDLGIPRQGRDEYSAIATK